MLAGNIKLKHFVAMVIAGMVLCGGLAIFAPGAALLSLMPKRQPAAPVVASTPAPQPRSAPTLPPAPAVAPAPQPAAAPEPVAAAPATTGRPADKDAFYWVGKDLGTSKKKDVTSGKSYKINVYQDDGHSTANRLKIDLDRDDRWDEKWTMDGTEVSRKVAPKDDENYTEQYQWNGSDWVKQ